MKESQQTFPDGSAVYPSFNCRGKWIAVRSTGEYVKDESNRLIYFDSSKQAAEALTAKED